MSSSNGASGMNGSGKSRKMLGLGPSVSMPNLVDGKDGRGGGIMMTSSSQSHSGSSRDIKRKQLGTEEDTEEYEVV